jgi:ABC-type nitrate/sulfonate/bicarbonate transport system substrate-binding protein
MVGGRFVVGARFGLTGLLLARDLGMSRIDRRNFLYQSARGALLPMAGLGTSSFFQGCQSVTTDISQAARTRVGLSAVVHPTYIQVMAGPVLFGPDFGLNITQDDYVFFDSHSTTVLAALSGQVNIVGASTLAHMAFISKGQPFKIFSPYVNVDDFVIAGRGEVRTLQQLLDPNVTVGIDDIGGAGQANFDAILLAQNAGFLVRDIPTRVTIGSTVGRTSALASGEVDATAIHLYQANQVQVQTGDLNIISTMYENVPYFMMLSVAAPESWLDENLETAAAFTAGVIQASRILRKSFAEYERVVDQFVKAPPSIDILRTIHDLAGRYDIWPADGGLQEERLEFMIRLGRIEEVFDADLTPADVVDTRPRDMALELLAGAGA